MSLVLLPATRDDAVALARIWLTAMDNPTDKINRMKYGTANRDELIAFFATVVQKEIDTLPNSPYLVVKDKDSGEIISYAQWVFPDENESEQSAQPANLGENDGEVIPQERSHKNISGIYEGGPDGMNFSFISEYYRLGAKLEQDTMMGRKHFKLGNLATHPKHERRGAASQLVRWVFDKADAQQVPCYLDTNINGLGRPLYEKLGFRVARSCEFDFEKHGGVGKDSLVSMVREPRAVA